jgi:WD40 repeat protein
MNLLCPNEKDLQGLLADRLPEKDRTSVEGHIENCAACQRQLDELTRSGDLKRATSRIVDGNGPAFLARLQSDFPSTLFDQAAKSSQVLQFPGPTNPSAPLGQIGDFEILQELGSGSFGWVFRARERTLDRIVALKVLKPEMTARPDAVARFEREARKASLLHDHIVSVFRFEKPSGFPPYLVMEFVEGETLEARLKREGALTPESAAAIARQVALGLAAAHERGMVHRDIKPANILLDQSSGRAKISDFGLARDIIDESIAVTGAGELAGTAPYMSPEHFRAPEKVDGRSDIFSLGVVLYQLLTGKLPFRGSFLQIHSGIMEDDPVAPTTLRANIPADLETIALTCLEKDPARRYATAQAVAEELRRYQAGEPILSRPVSNVERTVKWAFRKPAHAALIGVAGFAALVCIGLAAGLYINAELQGMNKELTKTKGELETTIGQVRTQEAHVTRLNYVADMNLAYQAWQDDNFTLLDQLLAAYENSSLRGFEWQYLRWLAASDGTAIGPKDAVTTVAFDPTGRLLALGVATAVENSIQVWSAPTSDKPRGEMLFKIAGQPAPIVDAAFHPKGDLLITSDRQGTVSIWDYRAAKRTQSILGSGPLAVSGDGKQLAYLRSDGGVQRWSFANERESGEPLYFPEAKVLDEQPNKGRTTSKPGSDDKSSKPGADDKSSKPGSEKGRGKSSKPGDRGDLGKSVNSGIEQLAFSGDGQFLVAAGGFYKTFGAVAIWHAASGKRLSLEDAEQGDLITSVACSPDGASIAAVGFDHTLRVWDARTGKVRFRRVAHKLEGMSVTFDATGNRVATAGWDKVVMVWNARTGEEIRSLRGNRGTVTQLAFSPDKSNPGQDNLVSLNEFGELRWWDADQEQSARIVRHPEPVHAVAFSPRGRYLASLGRSSQAIVQEIARSNRYDLPIMSPGARAAFSDDELSLLAAGEDGVLQTWSITAVSKPVHQSGNARITSQRVLTAAKNQWSLSKSPPVAAQPMLDLINFGDVPQPAPSIVAVDRAGAQLAFVRSDGRVVVRRRVSDTEFTDTTLPFAGKSPASQAANALAFSPDGSLLAAGMQDFETLIWDTSSSPRPSGGEGAGVRGQIRHRLKGHLCFVSCVAFSPDGKRLVSGSEDWTIKIWDFEVGRATLTLAGHKGRIRHLAFSPDGNWLASASEDGTARLWPGVRETAEERHVRREPQAASKVIRGEK